MYYKHPSTTLNRLFSNRPYQGTDPMKAKYLFIGLDANYAEDIDQSGISQEMYEYLDDDVLFWEKYGVHHPFLLDNYKGDGKFYHRSFAKIGFTKTHAPEIAFIELLHLPTYGRSKLVPSDLDDQHLAWLNRVILEGDSKYIFMPASVGNLMRRTGHFPWIAAKPDATDSELKVWFTDENKTVFWHYHFSTYGKFAATKEKQAVAIRGLINDD
ncbi:MAG: hypothetical protein MRK00_08065 [Nitrosomonas sp.]|nr:hypothetical protein [Nitrosomonas sp.]